MAHVHLPAGWQPDRASLAGRVVLVTGASGGLGRAAAVACAAAGATVVLAGRKQRRLEPVYDAIVANGGAEPMLLPIDFSGVSPRDLDAVADAVQQHFGHLDGILHAAAHFSGLTPLAMHKPEDWLRGLQVNLTAPFLLQQALQPLLDAAPDPAVVFVLDDPARMRRAHWNSYGVAKAGLEALAEMLHEETDSTPLRVHALLPAPMRTALRRAAWFGENALAIPPPDATAPAVVYLLSADGAAARGKVLDLR